MRWALELVGVDDNLCLERLPLPTEIQELLIKPLRDRRKSVPWRTDVTCPEAETSQDIDDVVECTEAVPYDLEVSKIEAKGAASDLWTG
jgi:hypothetical protein